jgi:hypothetical protein
MRSELTIAERDRVNLERARIARAMLEIIKAKSQAQVPAAAVKTSSPAPRVEVARRVEPTAQPAAHATGLTIWHWAEVNFRKLAHHICALLPAKRSLRPAHQKV